VSCGEVCRHSSDPKLLWLWRRPVATAPIRPLAWEPPYAAGAALEKAKRQKKKKKKKKNRDTEMLHWSRWENGRGHTRQGFELWKSHSRTCTSTTMWGHLSRVCTSYFYSLDWKNIQNLIWILFLFFNFFLFFGFLGPHPWHMEVPRLGVGSELHLPAYTTTTSNTRSEPLSVTYTQLMAMPDP